MRLLWALNHGYDSVSKRMGRTIGVTGPQRLVVRMIGCFPGASAGELAGLLHSHPSTLTGVLRRLEMHGLITRATDPQDGRRAQFGLTGGGRNIDRTKVGTIEAAMRRALQGLPSSQVAAAERILERIARELDATAAGRTGAGRRRVAAAGGSAHRR